ncbi:MAG: sugar phosphate isomerase/epimerase [Chthonomonadales bacterium]
MRIGMNLLLWSGNITDEHFPLLGRLKSIGFDGVEIPLFGPDPDQLVRTSRVLKDLGLACTSTAICSPETSPISPDPAIRAAAVDHMKKHVDYSATLNSEIIIGPFHSPIGHFSGKGRTADEWKWGVETMRASAEYAATAGIKLSTEPLNRFECYFLNTAADSDRFVKEVSHPSFGYLYDSFHANIEEQNIYDSVVKNSAGINHVHISENHRGVPGTGHVQWADTFRALKDVGYDGWLTIEAFGRALPELAAATCIWRDLFDTEEGLGADGFAFVKKMWAS